MTSSRKETKQNVFPFQFQGQDYDSLRRRHDRKNPFVDSAFVAGNDLLVDPGSKNIFTYAGGRLRSGSGIQWLRPHVRGMN